MPHSTCPSGMANTNGSSSAMTNYCRSMASVVSLLGEPMLADDEVPEVDDPTLAECTLRHLWAAPVSPRTGAADADELFDGACWRAFGVITMPFGNTPTGNG